MSLANGVVVVIEARKTGEQRQLGNASRCSEPEHFNKFAAHVLRTK